MPLLLSAEVRAEGTFFPRPIAELVGRMTGRRELRRQSPERRRVPCSGKPLRLGHNDNGLLTVTRDALRLARQGALHQLRNLGAPR